MIDKNVVTRIVDEWLEGKDYFLVDVTVSPDDKIVVEIDHAEGVWIDDCVELSRYIESKLDREEEDYELEVGSAGIGQPFKVLQQYLIHIGKEVEILTKEGKKLEGVLKDANEENFTVTIEKKVKPEEVSLAIGKGGMNIKLASMLTEYTIDVYRELDESAMDEDIYLDEFKDEIDEWVITAIKNIGLDTAKAVLNAPREMLIEKADLEENTVDDVLRVLRAEFEE